MASPLEIVSLRFGPVGTDGTRFSVPINRVETVTPVGITEQAIIRFRMPEDVDIEVQSAMGFHVPVSNTPTLKLMALLITTGNNEYLFPYCRIDHDNLAPVIVRFTVLIDTSLNDDNGNAGCCVIVNGSRRPVDEGISFELTRSEA